MSDESRLAAMIDGVTLAEPATKDLWKEFSAYMDAHEADMAGFARLKGWFSVAPEYRQGKAVLLVRTTATAPMPPPAPRAKPPAPKAKTKQQPPRPKAKVAASGKPGPAGKPKPKPNAKPNAAPAKKSAAPQGKGAKPKR